jgi:hypothetical protein
MQGDKTLKDHENLMGRMARTLGPTSTRRSFAATCRRRNGSRCSCPAPDAPIPKAARSGWTSIPSAEAAPGYCRNADRIAELARFD